MLAGCGQSQYAEQPELVTKGPNHSLVLVAFVDAVDEADLQARCKGANQHPGACSHYYPPPEPGKPATLIIIALEPADFNDGPRLAFWGHELAHGRGWKHKTPPS